MLWEELSAKKFSQSIDECGSVCVLPLGVIEKHGDHLPLGTDMLVGQAVCKRAAEMELAMVFPYYFLGQICIARHYRGCVAVSHRLQMDALREICDEISRNGFKKILIASSHGGNRNFLPYFAQEMPRLNRDYGVYIYSIGNLKPEQRKIVSDEAGTADLGQHAGLGETSVIMHIRPELADLSAANPAESLSQGRLDPLKEKGLFSAFGWYGDFPHHFAGDPGRSSPELGKKIFDMDCSNLAEAIKALKAEKTAEKLIREYGLRGEKPE